MTGGEIGNRHARILWWGNVRNLSFQQRLAFAARHHFDALNISPSDILAQLNAGETLASLKRMAGDAGVSLTYLDPVVSWLPDWQPNADAAEMVSFLSAGLGREFEFANALGIDRMLTITCFPPGKFGQSELVDHLGGFAEKAAAHGVICVLEAMPMWGLGRFEEVVNLWRALAMPNVRLLFDTWHYCRGGRADHLIAQLPIGAIDHVQIADGSLKPPSGRTLFDDCLYYRQHIGEGELPLDDLLSLLNRHGHLQSVGPEIFSSALDSLSAEAIAARIMPGFEAILKRHKIHETHREGSS